VGGLFTILRDLSMTIFVIAAVTFFGSFAALIVLSPVSLLRLFSGGQADKEIPHVIVVGFVLLGMVLAVWSFVRTVRYSLRTRRTADTSRPPQVAFYENEVGLVRRVEFQRRAYLFTQLHWATTAAGLGALFIVVVSFGVRVTPAPVQPPEIRFTSENVADLFWLGSALLTGLVIVLLKLSINICMPSTRAAIMAHQCLHLERDEDSVRRRGIIDPLGNGRKELARTARALTAAGRRVDAPHGSHPIGSVLHGAALQLRAFSERTESLGPAFPPAVTKVLYDTITVLVGPLDYRFYVVAGQNVQAFNADGSPLSALRATRRGWLTRVIVCATDSLDMYSRLSASIWSVATLIIVVVLIATGVLDLSEFQLQK
jgi:hypothetical protein